MLKITFINEANKNLSFDGNGINYPVKMAGFTHTDYLLEKWVKILTDNGYTVAVWEETGCIGSKTRSLDNIYSPGCHFTVEERRH